MAAPARSFSSLRPALWAVLGAWFGAQALFGLLALSAFEAGVGPELAARVVARVLGPLELGGAAAGLALALMGGALRRGRVAVGLPLLLAVLCLISHFGVSPALAEIQLGSPDSPADTGLRFAQLHRLSAGLYFAAVAGVLALGLLHARGEREPPGGAS